MRAPNSIRDGHYAVKQIYCRDRLISWSHRSRYSVGLELARTCGGGRILDYGSGDGTFLASAMTDEVRPEQGVGAELDPSVIDDCRDRLSDVAGLSFLPISDLERPEHAGGFDAVFCMEVLEHVVDLDAVIDQFERLLAQGGRLFVSVPVETGLPLLFKQTYRRIAGLRGIGDYPGVTPYSAGELVASLFPGARQHIDRPVHLSGQGFPSYDHKGFNWRRLSDLLSRRFEHEGTIASPIRALTPALASQVWLLYRRR